MLSDNASQQDENSARASVPYMIMEYKYCRVVYFLIYSDRAERTGKQFPRDVFTLSPSNTFVSS